MRIWSIFGIIRKKKAQLTNITQIKDGTVVLRIIESFGDTAICHSPSLKLEQNWYLPGKAERATVLILL